MAEMFFSASEKLGSGPFTLLYHDTSRVEARRQGMEKADSKTTPILANQNIP